MKFLPLGNQPNISASRYGANKMSMQLDSRGLPHICWMENKNGHNEIHYKFWDGLQWTYHNESMVGWAKEEITSSNNSIILGENEKPNIVFCRKLPNSKSAITVAKPNDNFWLLDELEVNYDVKWVGITKYDYSVNSSSSSSSSNNNSSSSSSGDDARFFVLSISTDNIARIYGITTNGWNLLTEKSIASSNGYPSTNIFKIIQCSKYIALAWQSNESINYNFFNINDESWTDDTFQFISINGLICSGIDGYGQEDTGILTLASIEKNGSEIKTVNRTISSDGTISSFGSLIIESENSTVYGNNNFVVFGYTSINMVANNGFPIIIAIGARTAKYTFDGSMWSKEFISIDGIGNGFFVDAFTLQNHNVLSMVLSVNGKDVYFLKEDSSMDAFLVVAPEFTILNSQRLFVATWEDKSIRNGSEIRCTWKCRVGDILRESLTRVNVVVPDEEDPECYTSSSSSSTSSSSSSNAYSNSTSTSQSSTSDSSMSEPSESSSSESNSSLSSMETGY